MTAYGYLRKIAILTPGFIKNVVAIGDVTVADATVRTVVNEDV
jgi:hypothetical protein